MKWFHSFNFPNETITGVISLSHQELLWSSIHFPLKNCSVLDIGCWDGFYSYKAYMAGAKSVLGIDLHPWSTLEWITKFDTMVNNFGLDRNIIKRKIHSIYNLRELPKHDVIFCMGVLYHLRYPVLAVDNCYEMSKKVVIFETAIDTESSESKMTFHKQNEYAKDYTNWFIPTESCMINILESAGFRKVESNIYARNRGIFHAYK